MLQIDEDHDLYSDLKEIQTAAKRSADITKQLLAFARKEIISPKQLDLNDTVESMLNMLRRLIGEDIDLVLQPASDKCFRTCYHLWYCQTEQWFHQCIQRTRPRFHLKIYLPLIAEEDADNVVPEKKAAAGGAETILLVKDEPSILRMTGMMLSFYPMAEFLFLKTANIR